MRIYFAKDNVREVMPGVQAGDRPFLVTSNDTGNELCNKGRNVSIMGIWGSKVIKYNKTFQPTKVILGAECGLKCPTEFSAEQPRALNINQLQFYIGDVSADKIPEVNKAIAIANGLASFDESIILDLIDDIIMVDRLFAANIGTEEDYRKKVRRIKELNRYCADHGFNGQYYLDKFYYNRGALCG